MEPGNPTLTPLKSYQLTTTSISYTKSVATSSNSIFSLFKQCTSPSPPTYILNDISIAAYPSQILAIVGPSGAGKSTLLDILAARTSPSSGSLLLNSAPITNLSSYRKLSAYVPQHDTFLTLLTVSETFTFAARLLNPKSSDVSAIVTSLLKELGLAHLAGTPLSRGLSGGERRRISIGLSLLHDPAVLLLDEPTSGLDSKSALNVVQTLKFIAISRHRTVILSIHQPSFKILSTIDRLLLLSKGTVVHHGTMPSLENFLLSNGYTVPPQLNPLEYTMEILNQLQASNNVPAMTGTTVGVQSHVDQGNITDAVSNEPDSIATDNPPASLPPTSNINSPASQDDGCDKKMSIPVRYKSSRAHEVVVLFYRFWKIIYRTRQLLLTNTLEALIVGIVLGTIYINISFDKQGMQKRFGLFAFTLTFLLSSTTETLPIFINERPILLRETSSGVYRLSSYILANTLVFIPYLLAIAIIYSVSVYFLVGLCSTWQAFAYFLLVTWIVVLVANSFVLFISSIAPNYIAGTSLITILLGCFFLFSGYFISQDGIPKYWLFMHFLSMYKYALDALLINEYSCLVDKCFVWYEGTKSCMVSGNDVLLKRGLHEGQRWFNIYILVGFFVFYRVLCLLVLIRRVSRSKK